MARRSRGVCLALCATALLGCGDLVSYLRVRMAPKYLDAAEAGADFALQGEYALPGGPVAAQVVALGDGRFRASFYRGGLPGAGWNGAPPAVAEARRDGDVVAFSGETPATLRGGVLRVELPGRRAVELPRAERTSPTEGAPPPPGAIVLFDGSGLEEVEGAIDERGWLEQGAETRRPFGSFRLHVEFLTPFEPTLDAQGRGNSGVYLQRRYEIQILDSFGLPAGERGAGSIYGQRAPELNMSYPPLTWQTYDIDFTAAWFDEDGRKVAPARVSVRHNGVPIHTNVVLTDKTGLGDPEGPDPAPILFQDHWHPVRFRNVWIVPVAREAS